MYCPAIEHVASESLHRQRFWGNTPRKGTGRRGRRRGHSGPRTRDEEEFARFRCHRKEVSCATQPRDRRRPRQARLAPSLKSRRGGSTGLRTRRASHGTGPWLAGPWRPRDRNRPREIWGQLSRVEQTLHVRDHDAWWWDHHRGVSDASSGHTSL